MILIRDSIEGDAVLGTLLVGGVKVCDTLENRATLIPYGEYKLSVSKSPKFKRDLALVYNDKVPATRGIRIHAGNSAQNSRGCILVGSGRCGDRILDSKSMELGVTAIARNDRTLVVTGNGMV